MNPAPQHRDARWAVIITRPVGRARALVEAVRRLGQVPVVLPTASLRLPDDVPAARAGLARAAQADLVIFTSVAAVQFSARLLSGWRPRGVLLAVGPSTARAGRRRCWSLATSEGRYDSEALLALPQLAEIRGRQVAIITAPGGRDRLRQELLRRAAQVDEVYVYQRCPARWNRRHQTVLEQAPPRQALLLSSVEALRVLETQLAASAWTQLRNACAIAASERVAAALRERGFGDIAVAASALPRDLIACLGGRIGTLPAKKSSA